MIEFDLKKKIEVAAANPETFLEIGLDYVEAVLDGGEVPSTVSPLVQLMEFSSQGTTRAINEALMLDRRHNPKLANDWDDLYGHMSDVDYLDRFAKPSRTTLNIAFPREELVMAMVKVEGSSTKKIVIPRYTQFTIKDEIKFTLLYPIEIRLLPHGALQIVYNTEKSHPLQTLQDNVLEWDLLQIADDNAQDKVRKWVSIKVPLYQLEMVKESRNLIVDETFNENFEFKDQYSHCRVFVIQDNGVLLELATTHSELDFDVREPTAVLEVTGTLLTVKIPSVYSRTGVINGSFVRVDIYTTNGPMELPLSNFKVDNYTRRLSQDYDNPALDKYSVGVFNLTSIIYSHDKISGGSNGLPFEDVRRRVIHNATGIDTPITPVQVREYGFREGFDIVNTRDSLTKRIYLATKNIPNRPGSNFSVSIGSAIGHLQAKYDDIVLAPFTYSSKDRVTIGPKTLFKMVENNIEFVSRDEYDELMSVPIDRLIELINKNYYVFSPFYNVLDTSDDVFECRPYYLNNKLPVKQRRFIAENETAELEVRTEGIELTKVEGGWRLRVSSIVGDSYEKLRKDQVFLQLAFTPKGEQTKAFINGELIYVQDKKNYIWEFFIGTNYNFDKSDNIIVSNFCFVDSLPRELPMGLDVELFLYYSVSDYQDHYGLKPSGIDNNIGRALLPLSAVGIIEESFTFDLGSALTRLSSNARPIASSVEYLRYETDVYATYLEDIYEMDPKTGRPRFEIKNGKVVLFKLHSMGDLKYNEDGSKVLLYQAGEIVLDEYNQPIVADDRKTLRLTEIFVVDGNYYFTNNEPDLDDLQYTTEQLAEDIIPQVTQLNKKGMEETFFWFYPKKTLGEIDVLIDDGRLKRTRSQLSFKFRIYLTENGFFNKDLKVNLEKTISEVTNRVMKRETINSMIITKQIELMLVDEDIRGIEVDIFSGNEKVETFTVKDKLHSPSVKRLVFQTDEGKIGVEEDIKIDWYNHLPKDLY